MYNLARPNFDLDVILSLVRTSRVGYLRDIRRLTVALSRARLGLYILGRREVFEACYELKDAFSRLLARPDKLTLVTNEMYPTTRLLDDEVATSEMEGVEHLGQYVQQMVKAKVEALKANGGTLPPVNGSSRDVDMEEAEEDGGVPLEEDGLLDEPVEDDDIGGVGL